MAGQDLTSKSVPFSYKGLNGGLNSTASPLTLQVNESSKLLNIDFDKFGSAQKRSGYLNLNTTALNSGAQVTGLHWYEQRSGNKILIATAGSKIYSNDLSATFTDITGAATLTAGYLWKFQTFLDKVFMTNGQDAPLKWDGTGNVSAMTLPTDITKPKWIKQYQGYTFVADSIVGGIRQTSRINWSEINAETWLDTDFAYISWNDGQAITGLEVLGDRLVIFKSRSIWIGIFTGDVDVPFQFQKTQSHVGCASGYSIQFIDNGLMFLGEDGVYFFDGNQSSKVSNRLNTTIYSNNNNLSGSCVSMYQKFKNRYWVSQFKGGQTESSQIITYDNFNDAFSIYEGTTVDNGDGNGVIEHPFSASAMTILYNSGSETPYFGDYDGWIYRADFGLDDYPAKVQTAIESYWYSRWMDYDDLTNQKAIIQFDVYYQLNSGTLSVAYSYDFEESDSYTLPVDTSSGGDLWDSTFIWDSSNWSGSGGGHKRLDITSRGRLVRIGFKNNILTQTFRIDGLGQLAHLETNQ